MSDRMSDRMSVAYLPLCNLPRAREYLPRLLAIVLFMEEVRVNILLDLGSDGAGSSGGVSGGLRGQKRRSLEDETVEKGTGRIARGEVIQFV